MLRSVPLAASAALEIPRLLTAWLEEAIQARARREWAIFVLMGQRALLMQIAHPLVARGVEEHSDFPQNALRRLGRTFDLSMKLFTGTEEEARAAAAIINRTHKPVRGAAYDARDPTLGLWVWATLVDSAIVGHELFVGALTPEQKQIMLDTYVRRAALLGLHEGLPCTADDLRQYIADQINSGAVHVGPTSRRLAQPILGPAPQPFRHLTGYLARATLPATLRAQFGLPWSLPEELAFTLAICPLANQLLSRLTPEFVCLQESMS